MLAAWVLEHACWAAAIGLAVLAGSESLFCLFPDALPTNGAGPFGGDEIFSSRWAGPATVAFLGGVVLWVVLVGVSVVMRRSVGRLAGR